MFLPGKSHGQRNLAGYSPWSHKESDMTKQQQDKYNFENWVTALDLEGAGSRVGLLGSSWE